MSTIWRNMSQSNISANGSRSQSKLILCFDGTGNQYNGDTSDTNVAKLYQKFDRKSPNQYHYYQPGIGTYTAGTKSLNAGPPARLKRSVSQKIDQAFATTFDSHVIAGYKFLMSYYHEDDHIYIIGFSRGAFTARYLARMLSTIGLLSMGNEEMVPFAYKSYQQYRTCSGRFKTAAGHERFLHNFKTTFCRPARVHFLGLFDCVNSVKTFDIPLSKKLWVPKINGTAKHVRHAVSIDERRSKFRPALLDQDKPRIKQKKRFWGKADKRHSDIERRELGRLGDIPKDDIKEIYFAGNHGDVGGGWLAKGKIGMTELEDPLQLSDLALEWMITEIMALPVTKPEMRVDWNEHRGLFLKNFAHNNDIAINAPLHDPLMYGGGLSWASTTAWRLLENLPFRRKEYINGEWVSVFWPPAYCDTRDIPEDSVIHPSVEARMRTRKDYRPANLPERRRTYKRILA